LAFEILPLLGRQTPKQQLAGTDLSGQTWCERFHNSYPGLLCRIVVFPQQALHESAETLP
jgi:hypothetical protein